MPKDYKKSIEKFENDMGFKSCDLKPGEANQNDLIFSKNMEKISGDCETIKGDIYNCTTYLDPKKGIIIKSDCEKKE